MKGAEDAARPANGPPAVAADLGPWDTIPY